MKSASNDKPLVLHHIGNNKHHFNYNVVEHTDEETGEKSYTYDQIEIKGEPSYNKIVEALIKERYSINEEMAINRQRENKPDEWQVYFEYCESVKQTVKQHLHALETPS